MRFRHFAPAFAAAASAVTFLHAGALVSALPVQAEPLTIANMGSMEAGGRVIDCQTVDGGDANNKRQTPGHLLVDQVYASYIYPQNQRYPYPILFNPGGGHTARFYDTTPDGREGWLTLFAREGFPTYGVDRVNTGRSGSDICKLNAVRLGLAPISEIPITNRYSAESAWVIFRWGPKYGEPYPNTQFPIEAADAYYPQTLTTYRDPAETQKSVAAFSALIDKIDAPGVILQTWSSSGLMGYLTAIERSDKVKGILAVESSATAFGDIPKDKLLLLAKVPIIIMIGDRAPDRVESSRAFQKEMTALGGDVTVDVLPEAGIYGNGHTLAAEKNNKQTMYRLIAWMEGHVFNTDKKAGKPPAADEPPPPIIPRSSSGTPAAAGAAPKAK
jgi:pimeloyl-ACP methyl ester carboxylesterase